MFHSNKTDQNSSNSCY